MLQQASYALSVVLLELGIILTSTFTTWLGRAYRSSEHSFIYKFVNTRFLFIIRVLTTEGRKITYSTITEGTFVDTYGN